MSAVITAIKEKTMFGEKAKEGEIEVWQSPKYLESRSKAIELINSNEYKGVLLESDFWILMNKQRITRWHTLA